MNWLDRREDLRQTIFKEINYTEETFKDDVRKFREWLNMQPHLPQFIGDHVLEVFLLSTKSLQRAKQRIDGYYTAKTQHPYLFHEGDPTDIIRSTDAFNMIYLPKVTSEGCRVLFITCKKDCGSLCTDIKDYIVKLFLMADYWYNFGPLTSGAILFVDFTNFSALAIAKVLASPIKSVISLGQDANPVRVKKLIFYNVGSSIIKFIELVLTYANPKYSQRLAFITQGDFDKLKNHLPEHILPKDYGGKELSTAELVETWDKNILGAKDWWQQLHITKSDESKRIGKQKLSTSNTNFGLDGTFKKLTID